MTSIRTNLNISGNEKILKLVDAGMQKVRDSLQVLVPQKITHQNVTLRKITLIEAEKVVYSRMKAVVCGVFRYFGKANGYILVSVDEGDLGRFIDHFTQLKEGNTSLEDPHVQSAVSELSNILGSSFLSAVADMAGVKIEQAVPEIRFDFAGSIINTIMARQNTFSAWMYLIEGTFQLDGEGVSLQFTNIPASQEESIFELGLDGR
jgi:chemotaxis protein CheC